LSSGNHRHLSEAIAGANHHEFIFFCREKQAASPIQYGQAMIYTSVAAYNAGNILGKRHGSRFKVRESEGPI
jgi:hypothetical protein